MTDFLQTPPRLRNAWASDRQLRETIHFHLGDELFQQAEGELESMGELATRRDTIALARQAEAEPPLHIPYSAWGERIDEIKVSPAYLELGRLGVEAGITGLPYEDSPYSSAARVVWAGLLALWGPSSALYSCPVAMTDGAARTLLEHGDLDDISLVGRLTTRDFASAWTSGQWMTETTGGSDVSRTGTVARRGEDGRWRLHGTKWFSSATTSEMALTLARPEGAPEGSRGLSLFRIERSLTDGTRNAIVVRRLKEKLGTRALPTAELELQGALAYPVGDPYDGGGLRRIATMLNITRIHNSLGATGGMGRGLAYARAYAEVREVFGRPLHQMPAHRATLTSIAVDYAAALALTIRCCELLGRLEHGKADDHEVALLRGLTPLAKLATAKWAVAASAEVMESIGGVGYCEDSGIPAYVRNTHVLPIWEGTTNVLSLDFLRAAARSGALEAIEADMESTLGSLNGEGLFDPVSVTEPIRATLGEVMARARAVMEDERGQFWIRWIALGIASSYACTRLLAQGEWAARRGDARTISAAMLMLNRGLLTGYMSQDLGLAFDEDPEGSELS
jgi:alkylation response protein AidB-like acyl-CoA dehydrogenase